MERRPRPVGGLLGQPQFVPDHGRVDRLVQNGRPQTVAVGVGTLRRLESDRQVVAAGPGQGAQLQGQRRPPPTSPTTIRD
ncbi:MAG TPA: hypothetical protein VMS17_14955 [Gemmataceae bacterium]|nr:hypothetical protein [Gemmataceae bacterium]